MKVVGLVLEEASGFVGFSRLVYVTSFMLHSQSRILNLIAQC